MVLDTMIYLKCEKDTQYVQSRFKFWTILYTTTIDQIFSTSVKISVQFPYFSNLENLKDLYGSRELQTGKEKTTKN